MYLCMKFGLTLFYYFRRVYILFDRRDIPCQLTSILPTTSDFAEISHVCSFGWENVSH